MRTGITLAKVGGKWTIKHGPDVDLQVQKESFKAAIAKGDDGKTENLQLWESGSGKVKEYSFEKIAARKAASVIDERKAKARAEAEAAEAEAKAKAAIEKELPPPGTVQPSHGDNQSPKADAQAGETKTAKTETKAEKKARLKAEAEAKAKGETSKG